MKQLSIWAWVVGVGLGSQAFGECTEVGYLATFDVKPGEQAAFEAAIKTLAAKVQEVEEGVLLYEPYRGESETRYYMLERYRNERSRQMHAKAPEIRALFGPAMSHLASPLVVEPITALCAGAE